MANLTSVFHPNNSPQKMLGTTTRSLDQSVITVCEIYHTCNIGYCELNKQGFGAMVCHFYIYKKERSCRMLEIWPSQVIRQGQCFSNIEKHFSI